MAAKLKFIRGPGGSTFLCILLQTLAMATLRGVTPDLEDVSDSEPEDLMPPVEVEHTGSFISCSTPNSSLLSADLEPPAAATMATTPEQSFSSVPRGETSFMAILREINAIVKRFDSRLDALEQTVAELRQKETTATVTSSGKGKPAVTDEIRVRCTPIQASIASASQATCS